MRKKIEWLYKPANLSQDYTKEILELFKIYVPDLELEKSTRFIAITEHDNFKQKCPNLYNKLCDWKLGNRLAEMAFIIVPPNAKFPIHRDYPKWEFRNIGLLLPVLNCEDTYTAMYDAEVLPEVVNEIVGDSSYSRRSQKVDEENAKELCRVPSDTPNWINVYQPHAPRSNHNKYRVTFSIRFRPELFDIIEDGSFEREMVKHD